MDGDIPTFLARSLEMDGFIKEVAAICQEIKTEKQSDKEVYLSFDEWNVWYHWQLEKKESPLWTVGRRLEEENYTLSDALLVGCMINTLLNNSDTVKIACLAQLVNVLSAITTEPGGEVWAQSIYYPFALASQYGRGAALKAEVSCDTYACTIRDTVPYLDVSAVLSEDQKFVTLFIVNRSQDEDILCTSPLTQGKLITHTTMAGGPANAFNSAENSPVTPREIPVSETGDLVIPAFSWNMLRYSLEK